MDIHILGSIDFVEKGKKEEAKPVNYEEFPKQNDKKRPV
jgi:hypothetical protein